MTTVLLAWELGAGLGHAGPLRRLALRLRAAGHRPVFALRDVVGPAAVLGADGFEVLPAPVWPRLAELRGRPFGAAGFGDILAVCGFARADDLAAMVAAWDALLALVRPDLIVADFSPTLCLAAHGALPVAVVGNGFTVPPIDRPEFPPLRPDRPPVMAESRLVDTVAEVQRRRGRPAPATLPALFDAPVRAIWTLPELDPYRPVRREPVLGPIETLPEPSPAPATPSVFAYLGGESGHLDALVQLLAESGGPLTAYLRGDAGPAGRYLAARGATVFDRPPPLAEVVPAASLVISHGGTATAHAALAAGRPQLLLPLQLEQDLTARALEALGVGVRIPAAAGRDEVAAALRRAIGDPALRDHALAWAGRVAQRPRLDALTATVAACLKLLCG